ncbi:hypothetical protein IWW50_000203 [Coemansia erecta]|nr:hypothetical protein GGF43_000395 [Coemansia sp. RSA 2618]KAJ2830572.1 hypothetical protein IWW50_000203 [Coemansia erecta]
MAKGSSSSSSSSRRRHSALSLTPLVIAVTLLAAQCHAIDFGHPELFNGLLGQPANLVPGEHASRHYVDFHKHHKPTNTESNTSATHTDSDSDDTDSDDEEARRTRTIDLNVNLVPPHCPRCPHRVDDDRDDNRRHRDHYRGDGPYRGDDPYRDNGGNVGADQIANILESVLGHRDHCCPGVLPTSTQQGYYSGVLPTATQQGYPSVLPTSEQQGYPSVLPTATQQGYPSVLPTATQQGYPTVQPTSENNRPYYPSVEPTGTQQYSHYIGMYGSGEHALPFDNGYPVRWPFNSQHNVQSTAPLQAAAPGQNTASFRTGPRVQQQPLNSGAASENNNEAVQPRGPISIQAPRSVVHAPTAFSSNNNNNNGDDDVWGEGGIEPQGPRITHHPELAESSSAASPMAQQGVESVVSRWGESETQDTNSNSSASDGVQTAFSETVNSWDQMLRATKTANLPDLLLRQHSAPTNIDIPEDPKHHNALRLDPFTGGGGVDMYPTVELAALGRDAPGRISEDVWRLVDSLTPAEKAGQMTQVHVGQLMGTDGQLNATLVEHWIDTVKVGAIVGTPGNSSPHAAFPWHSAQALANVTSTVQRIAQARGSRIPVLWGLDAARGAGPITRAAMFPAGIGLAATFQPMHAYAGGRVAAKDARAAGYAWVFAPHAGISVDKRWAQACLGYGEDPALAAQMVRHAVRGLQGDYKRDRARVACCAKGFVGGGEQLAGNRAQARSSMPQDSDAAQPRSSTLQVTDAHLLEYHLPAFEAAVAAGAASIMQAPGSINGEALGTSPYYLRTLLRDSLQFRGVMLADRHAGAHTQTHRLHSAADARDAVFLALNNTSIDIGEEPANANAGSALPFAQTVGALVQDGRIAEDRLTESVARVLQLKKDVGLFDRPFADPQLAPLVGALQDVDAARDAVRESLTLLKNRGGVLPLSARDRVLFVGPHLNSTALLGGHMYQGLGDSVMAGAYHGLGDSVMAGVRKVAGPSAPTAFHAGFSLDPAAQESPADFAQLVQLARQADKIVVGLGESPHSGDLSELALDAHQIDLVRRLHAAAPRAPIISLLVAGRPRLLKDAGDISAAVVNAHIPGIHAGVPIAEMLYGRFSPSGRQPVTYPRFESQARDTIWQSTASDYAPAWPFGFGLSYSPIAYSNLTVSSSTLRPGSPVTVKVSVHNQGKLDQKEPVLLFTSHRFRTGYEPELFRLRRFNKVDIKAGSAAEVEFKLTAEELAYYNRDRTRVIDPTVVNITINALTPNERSISVNLLA